MSYNLFILFLFLAPDLKHVFAFYVMNSLCTKKVNLRKGLEKSTDPLFLLAVIYASRFKLDPCLHYATLGSLYLILASLPQSSPQFCSMEV